MPTTNEAARATFTNRTFGVEIEFAYGRGPRSNAEIARAINTAGIPCQAEGYNHQTRNHWKIVRDGSVSSGAEIVSPVLSGRDGLRAMRTVCRVLIALGCTVDTSCGLHVHIFAGDLNAAATARLVSLYNRAERDFGLRGALAPSRRRDISGACYYAGLVSDAVLTAANGTNDIASVAYNQRGRYYGLNLASYRRYRTVEFRAHQGSVDPAKIAAWIVLCLRFVETAKSGVGPSHERRARRNSTAKARFAQLLIRTGLKAYSRNGYSDVDDLCAWAGSYLASRRAHFAIREGRETGSVPRIRGRLTRCLGIEEASAAA